MPDKLTKKLDEDLSKVPEPEIGYYEMSDEFKELAISVAKNAYLIVSSIGFVLSFLSLIHVCLSFSSLFFLALCLF